MTTEPAPLVASERREAAVGADQRQVLSPDESTTFVAARCDEPGTGGVRRAHALAARRVDQESGPTVVTRGRNEVAR
jgi:hypothetical protein